LRGFKNWVLRKVFGLVREQVTEEWRKRHNDKFDGLHYLPILFRWLNEGEKLGRNWKGVRGCRKNAYMVLVVKLDRKDFMEDLCMSMSI